MKEMEKMKYENMEEEKEQKSNSNSSYKFQKKLITISFIILLIIACIIGKIIFLESTKEKKTINTNSKESNIKYIDNSNLNYTEEVLSSLEPDNSYKGPIFPDDGNITKEWVLNLIEYMKDLEHKKSTEEKYLNRINLLKLLIKAKNIFSEYKESLVDIIIPKNKNITIVGDIHGQFYDLLHIFEINGYPSENNIYVFNGDYVDRGKFSVECLTTLISFKILYPNYIFMSRGNHEDKSINTRYGFKFEVLNKFNSDIRILDCFNEFYKFLPLGHILNNEILIIHGGLFSKDGVTLNELKQINRFRDIPLEGLMCELLWSDPHDLNGTMPSQRGAGVYFGPDVTEKFLRENNLKLLIRSHEVRNEGYSIEVGGQTITVFSAPNYCDTVGNKGALIKYINGDLNNPHFIKFDASPHPKSY